MLLRFLKLSHHPRPPEGRRSGHGGQPLPAGNRLGNLHPRPLPPGSGTLGRSQGRFGPENQSHVAGERDYRHDCGGDGLSRESREKHPVHRRGSPHRHRCAGPAETPSGGPKQRLFHGNFRHNPGKCEQNHPGRHRCGEQSRTK